MILDPQVVRLAAWFATLQNRVGDVLAERLQNTCITQLSHVSQTLMVAAQTAETADFQSHLIDFRTPPHGLPAVILGDHSGLTRLAEPSGVTAPPGPPRPARVSRWKTTLERDIRPAIHRARGTLRAAAASFSDGSALAPLREDLVGTFTRQPHNISFDIAPDDSSVTPTREPTKIEVPLRRWLTETLQPTLDDLLRDLDARVAAAVDDATAELERIETVIDYHLFLVEDTRDTDERRESAQTGLGHGVRLVQQLADRLQQTLARIHYTFITATSAAMDDALAPLRAHRPEEVIQSLAVRESAKTPSWWQTRSRALRDGVRSAYNTAAPIVRELASDFRGILSGDQPRVGYWDLAIASDHADERLPAIYRRLFAEIPLGMSDLYRPRPALEAPCRKVLETWLSGQTRTGDRRSSLLVVGDRGAGKRTLVNRVRAELHGGLPVRWISLGPHLASEPRLCNAIADAADIEPIDDFLGLASALRNTGARQAIVLENGEQIFLRTPEGLARVQAFLDLLRATDDHILWVVLMVGPTATLLDTCLRLSLYFSQVVRLPPASGAFLEDMLRARHRVSGLGLRFRARRPPVVERLRRPFARADVLDDPAEEWFADLERIAAGNLQSALTYWQLAARVDQAGTEVTVRPLPRTRGRALTQLSLPQRLVLATLVQHGALTEAQILETLPERGQGAVPEIDDLRRRRLIEPSPHEADYLQLRSAAALPVTLDLRWRNML